MGYASPPDGLVKLTYASHALIGADSAEMLAICRSAMRVNPRLGITGALYYDGRMFFQVLEGEPQAVGDLFATIRDDPRHRGVRHLGTVPIAERRFGSWAMRFVDGRRCSMLAADVASAGAWRGLPDSADRIEAALRGI